MHEFYPNRMMNSSTVREIGPHGHRWHTVGIDAHGIQYEECKECGTRRVHPSAASRKRMRQDWLDGGPWDLEAEGVIDAEDVDVSEVPEVDDDRPRRRRLAR